VKLLFVPTLEKLLEVYRLPIGQARFDAYIAATVSGAQSRAELALLPLVSANPMAKAHVNTVLETWLALGVDKAAQEVIQSLESVWSLEASYKVGLTVLDDQKGGWTNRFLNDWGFRFPSKINPDWMVVPLWVSEIPSLEGLRVAIQAAVSRVVWQLKHGLPKTLLEMMQQEGFAQSFAGLQPTLDPDDLEYSRAVIQPFLSSPEKPMQFACLYGDAAAREVGYVALGLSSNAGLEVALLDYPWRQSKPI
jgi:hypothetical protein